MSEQIQSLGEEVKDYADAGYAGIWIHSKEQEDAAIELAHKLYSENYPRIVRWDGADGLRRWKTPADPEPGFNYWQEPEDDGSQDFLVALKIIEDDAELGVNDRTDPIRVCAFFMNVQMYVQTPLVAQTLLNYLHKAEGVLFQRFIVLSSVEEPSPEILVPQFTTLTHRLPDREQLRDILDVIATEPTDLPEESAEVESILDAASGMTRKQARDSFSLCLRHDPCRIEAKTVFAKKARMIQGNNLGLSLNKNVDITFDGVVGLDAAKIYTTRILANVRHFQEIHPDLRPRGTILWGLAGVGKSMFCAALGNSCVPSRPSIRWKMALTGSKYVSEGASKMHQVVNILETLAPVNVQVDEGLKGRAASYNAAGGGSQAQASEMDSLWLEWHEDSTADVFPIFTANEEFVTVAKNDAPFVDRFDRVFFLDYPTPKQLDQIWQYHMMLYRMVEHPEEYFDIKQRGDIPDCTKWVGRNVRNCCASAVMLDLKPVQCPAKTEDNTNNETAEMMREWAEMLGCRSAEYDDFYERDYHQNVAKAAAAKRPAGRDRRPIKKKVVTGAK